MFAREYLFIVSRWARDQLRRGAETPERRRQLRQLIEAAEALRIELPVASVMPANVISLEGYARTARLRSRTAQRARLKSFLDG
jgi:hypothetical protein